MTQNGKAHISKDEYLLSIKPNSTISGGRFWPKLSKGTSTCQDLYMNLFSGLYDHMLQRNSLEKLMFRKPLVLDDLAIFGHFRWSTLVKTFKWHIYTPRPFIWAYSQVSTTIRFKDAAWKRIDDGQTDGWTPRTAQLQVRISDPSLIME